MFQQLECSRLWSQFLHEIMEFPQMGNFLLVGNHWIRQRELQAGMTGNVRECHIVWSIVTLFITE